MIYRTGGDENVEKSNHDCHRQSERRNRQNHDLRKSGRGACTGRQKGAAGGCRPAGVAYHSRFASMASCVHCVQIYICPADIAISMGWQQPDELPVTLSALMAKAINDQCIPLGEGILHHVEGVDLIPANIELAGLEVALVNSMSREKMLKQVLDSAKREYDYILLDCTPSLGMLTVVAPLLWLAVRTMCEFIIISCGDTAINALAAADTTLIPVQAQYLSAKGLEQLLQTIQKVRRQINPKLKIEGILMTMTDSRTNYGKQISNLIRQAYGKHLKVFEQTIPRSVRAAETSAAGKSIFAYDPKGKVAEAYKSLAKEVQADADRQRKLSSERAR